MGIDREAFYAAIKRHPHFGANAMNPARRGLPPRQIGFDAILDVWEQDYADRDPAWLAYILATAWHETGTWMAPVREGFARTDEEAFNRVKRHIEREGLRDYVSRKENGHSYYGRGFVQLTWDENYRTMGARLGVGDQFYNDPELVMDPAHGAKIICHGMVEGLFRQGNTLPRYFGADHYDWHNARLIVNGRRRDGSIDKAAEIAAHGRAFHEALLATPQTAPVVTPAPTRSAPALDQTAQAPLEPATRAPPAREKPLAKSRTILAAMLAGLGYVGTLIAESWNGMLSAFPTVETPIGTINTLIIGLAAVVLFALATIVYARIDDRIKRGR